VTAGKDLDQIGVLRRREIEARIPAPLLEAFGREFGRERVIEVARRAIVEIAEAQGRELARRAGTDDLGSFARTLAPWTRDGSLEIEVVRQTARELHFYVTR
jgi:L-2-amino-thiazoline-4-carboxylic acid hydrolase